ncbi:MAG: TonB-dependent receptor, partial [Bacteroidota bacterium]
MTRFIIVFFLGCMPMLGFTQLQIDGDFQDQTLAEVLSYLEKEHQLVFSYTQDLIKNKTVDATFHHQTLEGALTQVFQNTAIDFEIVDPTYIILKPKTGDREALVSTICGQLQSPEGSALAFANILDRKRQNGTSTQVNGQFNWRGPFLETDTIELSYVGYQTKRLSVTSLRNCPVILLQRQALSFSEVLVKEYVTSGIEQATDLDHFVLRPNRIKVVPGLTEADVLQMVQILPGVQSLDESATGLHIRGGTPDQNLILWDGIPIYNGGHFFGMISAFNPYIVEKVKVYRGGFGAEYGGRISGVIDIASKEQIPQAIQADVGINFTHTDAAITLPFAQSKAALILSARRAYTDIIESPTYKKLSQRVFQRGKINETQSMVNEGADIDTKLDFVFNDLNAKWLWQPDQQNQIAFSAFGIFDQLDFGSEDFEDELRTTDKIDLSNIGWSGRWSRQWSASFSSDAILTYTDYNNQYQFSLGTTVSDRSDLDFRRTNDIQDLSFKWDHRWKLSKQLDFDFGYNLTELKVGNNWFFDDGTTDGSTENNLIHTGHFTFKPSWKNTIQLNTGMRWSYSTSLERSFWEPRFSFQYIPSSQWQLRASTGRYYQYLNQVIELNDLGLDQQAWVLSNQGEESSVAESWHHSLGFSFHPKDFQLEVEGYHKKLSGLNSYSPVFLETFQQNVEYTEGRGTVWGIDLLLKKKWKQYQTWLSYTYSRVWYEFETFNEQNPFPAPHDRPHTLTSVHQWTHRNWNFSVSWKYASGRVYTEANGFFLDDEDVFPDYRYEQTNAFRLSAYHRLDASILYQFRSQKGRMEGRCGLSFLNLYNRTNYLSRQYQAFYNDDEATYKLDILDRPMLRFTPNVVVR